MALLDAATRLREEGRHEEALDALRRLASQHPGFALAAQHFGAQLGQMGRPQEAEEPLRRALHLNRDDPVTRHALSVVLMAQGRYVEAWSLYDARTAAMGAEGTVPNLPFPRWKSWHPAGKRILIVREQGLGDQMQYARFVPDIVAAGGDVTMLTAPALVRLFADSLPGVRVLPAEGSVTFDDPDFWMLSSDLPGFAGATPDTLPPPPYLRANGTAPAMPGGFKIGLVTQGNPAYRHDARRSLPQDEADRLRASLPGTVISLHPQDSGARDLADTAAIVDRLDLVVTVDTSVAHLAGAMGKPCLTLIRAFAPDWRWMLDTDTTPWYPAMRLFRSGMDGDWTSAIDALVREARRRAA